MIAATILSLIAANGDEKRAIALASMLAIMVAAIILVGQLPKLCGFKISGDGLIAELAALAAEGPDGTGHGRPIYRGDVGLQPG
jgi:hypothetical protein